MTHSPLTYRQMIALAARAWRIRATADPWQPVGEAFSEWADSEPAVGETLAAWRADPNTGAMTQPRRVFYRFREAFNAVAEEE